MIDRIVCFIKKIILSGFLIYGYNMLAGPLNIIIPINIITIFMITVLGVPALFAFILIRIIIF